MTPIAGCCLFCLAAGPLAAEPVILVEDSELRNPAVQSWLPEEIDPAPFADGVELLRDIPGISGSRFSMQFRLKG